MSSSYQFLGPFGGLVAAGAGYAADAVKRHRAAGGRLNPRDYEEVKILSHTKQAARRVFGPENKAKMNAVPVTLAEYTRTKRNYGRRYKRNVRNLYRLTEAQRFPFTYRFQQYNAFGGGVNNTPADTVFPAGAQPLVFGRTVGGGTTWYPCHCYDLSGILNFNQNTTVTNPNCQLGSLSWSNTSSNPGWSQDARFGCRGNTNPDGSLAQNFAWQVDTSPGGAAATDFNLTAPIATSFLEWFDIRLVLYSRTNLPTRWTIKIVQFPEEDFNPAVPVSFSSTDTRRAAMWESLMSPYTYSTIAVNHPRYNKNMKVIHSYDCIHNPPTTVDGTNPNMHMKEVKIFKRVNQVQRYRWRTNDPVIDLNDNGFSQDQNNIDTNVHPKARFYLLIMAQSAFRTQEDSPSTTFPLDKQPTYDILIRKKHVFPAK